MIVVHEPYTHKPGVTAMACLGWLDQAIRRLMMRRLMRELGPERLLAAGLTPERLERPTNTGGRLGRSRFVVQARPRNLE